MVFYHGSLSKWIQDYGVRQEKIQWWQGLRVGEQCHMSGDVSGPMEMGS